jgi:PAS domain S-box-containing protein
MSEGDLKDILESVLDAIPHAVLVLKNRRIVFANPAVTSVFGWRPEEIVGRDTRILYRSEEDYEEVGRRFYSALDRERTHFEPFPCRRKDGQDIECMISTSRTGASLRDRMIVATYEDITERRVLEEAVRQTCRALEMRVQDQTQELSGVLETLSAAVGERIRIEDSLRESQQLLSDIISFIPDPTLVIDRGGKVIVWNRAIEEMTGVRKEDMIGRGDHEYALPFYNERRPILIDLVFVSREEIEKKYSFIQKEKNLLIAETDVPCVKGRKRILWGKASVIYNIRGEVVGAIESIRDITERKQIENAYRSSEDRFRKLTEATTAAIFIYQDDRYRYVNAGMEAITGFSSRELLNMPFWHIAHPDSRDMLREGGFSNQRDEGIPSHYEFKIQTKSGIDRWVDCLAVVADWEGEPAGLGTFYDVTARKLMEESLKESEQGLRRILDGIPIAVVVSRLSDDGILYFNPRAARIFGLSEETVSGKKIREFYENPEEREFLREELRKSRGIANEERIFRGADGDTFTALLSAVPIPYAGEEAALASFIDITERKKMEARLAQAAKMEAVGTLAGGVAHDFNNLLMGIQGIVSLMLMELPPDHPHVKKLQRIEEQVSTGAGLTNQILGFARAGQYEMKATNLNDLIRKTADLFGRTRKDITVHERFEPALWSVMLDRVQVEQTLLNLYVNAGQAMPGGGNLYLESDNWLIRDSDIMEVPVIPGRYVRISVTDTGSGMDEKTRKRIFEPFFTTKFMGKGAGLGLASVYGVVKAHQGYIFVTSSINAGARFDIYLPARLVSAVEDQRVQDGVVRGKETILIVDDEEIVMDVTRELIELMGYRVFTARSGEEGVDLYRKMGTDIDMVILDMIMPGMGGSEVFDRLREMNPEARILLSTGFSLSDQAQEIMDKGCNGFIQKPFQPGELSLKIRQILDA